MLGDLHHVLGLGQERELSLAGEDSGRTVRITAQDAQVMEGEMRRKLAAWERDTLAGMSRYTSQLLQETPCGVSANKEGDGEKVGTEVYHKYRVYPSQPLETTGGKEHMYIAGYHFHRMASKEFPPSFPHPVRLIVNPSEAIASIVIDYIRNPQLEEEFQAQKQRLVII